MLVIPIVIAVVILFSFFVWLDRLTKGSTSRAVIATTLVIALVPLTILATSARDAADSVEQGREELTSEAEQFNQEVDDIHSELKSDLIQKAISSFLD